MPAVLTDQAVDMLMSISTGAVQRHAAKKYPAMAQQLGQPAASPGAGSSEPRRETQAEFNARVQAEDQPVQPSEVQPTDLVGGIGLIHGIMEGLGKEALAAAATLSRRRAIQEATTGLEGVFGSHAARRAAVESAFHERMAESAVQTAAHNRAYRNLLLKVSEEKAARNGVDPLSATAELTKKGTL